MVVEIGSVQWTDIATFAVLAAQLVLLGIAAYIAYRQTGEARQLREEQSRPFVILDLEVRETIAELKISNIGRTIARNVTFEFEPPVETTFDNQGRTPLTDILLFKEGIPSLPPGKAITTLFDQLPARIGARLPDAYTVQVRYTDALGRRKHEETTVGYAHLVGTGGIRRRDIHDVHKQLETMAKTMGKWTAPGSSGIKVMSPDDIRKSWDERRPLDSDAASDDS